METEFTPIASFIGGLMIGMAIAILLLSNGRIAGISGILSSILPPGINRALFLESSAFLIGLIIVIPLYKFVTSTSPEQLMTTNPILIGAGGLLVGIGTALGSGCTSGHGVCGISRLSQRSIVATITFMVTAGITVFVLRHVMGS